jgi:alpha-1,3/alpha-1,6-mannosyltransferase
MRVAFLHPDLGLGGAERLVVDAASGLAQLGHSVVMYTSHYEPQRSFDETRSGLFGVLVYGDWLPRALFGRFHIVFAMLRMVWLALCVVLWHGREHDVLIVDQVSACVPLLKLLCPGVKVLFYCQYIINTAGIGSLSLPLFFLPPSFLMGLVKWYLFSTATSHLYQIHTLCRPLS